MVWMMTRLGLMLLTFGCGPKPTDTSEMKDVNPCAQGEILQADGSCHPAGEPIEQPPSGGVDTGRDTGASNGDTGASDTGS